MAKVKVKIRYTPFTKKPEHTVDDNQHEPKLTIEDVIININASLERAPVNALKNTEKLQPLIADYLRDHSLNKKTNVASSEAFDTLLRVRDDIEYVINENSPSFDPDERLEQIKSELKRTRVSVHAFDNTALEGKIEEFWATQKNKLEFWIKELLSITASGQLSGYSPWEDSFSEEAFEAAQIELTKELELGTNKPLIAFLRERRDKGLARIKFLQLLNEFPALLKPDYISFMNDTSREMRINIENGAAISRLLAAFADNSNRYAIFEAGSSPLLKEYIEKSISAIMDISVETAFEYPGFAYGLSCTRKRREGDGPPAYTRFGVPANRVEIFSSNEIFVKSDDNAKGARLSVEALNIAMNDYYPAWKAEMKKCISEMPRILAPKLDNELAVVNEQILREAQSKLAAIKERAQITERDREKLGLFGGLLTRVKNTAATSLIIEINAYLQQRKQEAHKQALQMTDKFSISLPFEGHQLNCAPVAIKNKYLCVLQYFVAKFAQDDDWATAALTAYINRFTEDDLESPEDTEVLLYLQQLTGDSSCVQGISDSSFRYGLISDILLLTSFNVVAKENIVLDYLLSLIREQHREDVSLLADVLLQGINVESNKFESAKNLIECWRKNTFFMNMPERRIMITANMSAGKSTIINALIGKPLTQTSQEACTGNLCYLYNKPFEDNEIHLRTTSLSLCASYDDLANTDKSAVSYIASGFRTVAPSQKRICIIDTPGVNSAINREHGSITRKALTAERYDKLVYVFNANRLGTDDEFRYLKYISENVPKEKIIFIVNKLDSFKRGEDSVASSIEGVKRDLLDFGFDNPVICPLSAYFALLLKTKHSGEVLTDDEQDVYDLYVKKFSKPEYDLSLYYGDAHAYDPGSEIAKMAAVCGIHSLEKILFGGVNQ
jgi:hypothetical protein